MTEPTADDVSILQLRCVDTAIDPAQDQPGAAWRSYPFTMQPQERTQWCWAAVAASVATAVGIAPRTCAGSAIRKYPIIAGDENSAPPTLTAVSSATATNARPRHPPPD